MGALAISDAVAPTELFWPGREQFKHFLDLDWRGQPFADRVCMD